MFTTFHSVYANPSTPSTLYPDPQSLDQEQEVKLLIASAPTLVTVDEAFTLSKNISCISVKQFCLTAVCNAYLKIGTYEACRKVIEVLQIKKAYGANIAYLFNNLATASLRLKSDETVEISSEISQYFPEESNSPAFKKEFENLAYLSHTLRQLNSKVESLGLDKVRTNAFYGNEAMVLLERREYKLSCLVAKKIDNEIAQDRAVALIFDRCCSFGDEEALKFALKIAESKQDFRDSYIHSLITACKKTHNKTLATRFAASLEDAELREVMTREIFNWEVPSV